MTGNMIGRVFNNRYQITERIGIGGMAEVYRAQDTVLGRMVAVKVMLPQYAADPEFTQRFRQEAASAANLQSPYIVNVYDWGQDDGTYYIVMEYVRGSDLKTAIQERGAINQRKVAEIGAQVCQALSVAHNQDIIHRDIKPQNIMIQPDGNVKVMDFGIARAKNSVKSQTSSVLGTAHYISPEQAQGKELTSASDIYSLGIVMYEAATGTLPFDGPDAVSVAMKQVNDLPLAPSEINPSIDPGLEAIIMQALEKDPRNRFATVSDMKHCLNDYLAGRPVSLAGAETIAMPVSTGAGSMSGYGQMGGTSVMPAVPKAGAPISDGAKSFTTTDPEVEAKKKRNRTIGIVIGIIAAVLIIGGIVLALSGVLGMGNTVPDVTGKTIDQAKTALTDAGYTVGTTSEVFSDTIDSGKVVSTDPAANAKADKGSKVNITLSKGKEQIEVPDLSGMTADQAQQALSKVGLSAKAGPSEHSDNVGANQIARQDPAAGTKVSKGSTITYIVSLGSESVAVPDVTGQSEASATTTLKNAGFTVETYYDSSKTVAQGNVISQTPTSNTKLEKGGVVAITVSTGASQHTVTVYTRPNEGGYVSSDSLSVDDGGATYFVITPYPNYTIGSVTDSTGKSYSVGAGNRVDVSGVTGDITVTVAFVQSSSSSSSSSSTTPATPTP